MENFSFSSKMARQHITATLSKAGLKENLGENLFWSNEFWPPNSPDLNLMDYFVWGVIEREVNKKFHENTDSLRAAFVREMTDINSVHVKRTCAAFRPRFEAVIKAEGSWIE